MKGISVSIVTLLGTGVVPFIIDDITEAVLAAIMVKGITPRLAYNGEVDGSE
jgi:biotin transporter BioY